MASVKMNNSIRFMANIEELVQRTNMTYIDAIVHYCEENKLEPETAGSMVGGKLKQLVQEEAEDLNLVQKTLKLPI
jgi:hypothetical protein